MKRPMLIGLAALAMAVGAPTAGSAQVRVSVRLAGPRYSYGYGYRTYVPRPYYSPARYYVRTYSYYPRYEAVRVYRPAPVVIYRRNHYRSYHREYRHW